MNAVGIVIFAVTYALVSARRLAVFGLDRPAAALLGAVACVAFGVLSPEAALASIDGDTLILLFGVMGMGALLMADGFFDAVEARLAGLLHEPRHLLGAIVWGSGILAAFITNDAVCLFGAPLVVRLVKRGGLSPVPFLLALATAANTGSVATLVGNPQNMLCGQLGDLDYLPYLIAAGPVALLGLAINHAVLRVAYRRALGEQGSRSTGASPLASPDLFAPRHLRSMAVVLATVLIYSLGGPLSWTATGGFVALMLLHRRDSSALWRHIDWSLLLFFAGLFVVVRGFQESGATTWFFSQFPLSQVQEVAGPFGLAGVFALGSNLVSNVPFILVVQEELSQLADPTAAWTLLAIASTFAGNLTLLGSAANIIVAEASREVGSFGFWEHFKVGAPIALLTTGVGALWVWGMGA